ncbi:MAG: hypothetical protein M4579_002443 [Chaenotheca gracillima]|nr:MAG: hypothetical protein M4579_002443 [Chaenotheca gracillima]
MISTLRRAPGRLRTAAATSKTLRRSYAATSPSVEKKEGDISSVFASLSGAQPEPLPARFAELKARLIRGREDQLRNSWERLLAELREEIGIIAALGPKVVPEIQFNDIHSPSESFVSEVKKRGVAVVRGVIPHDEARSYKVDVGNYVKANPHTKAFPPHDPQVYELYWSPSQVRARAHPNLLDAQSFLMSFWHSKDPEALISTSHPLAYADRLRIRQPGDSGFALGPHVDGGSVERWEENGYGLGQVYDKIWEGRWEEYDPWESSCRLPVVADRYNGPGACSMFRMFQGWLSMSTTSPNEGTLLVNPLLSRATAYYLLRPFFSPKNGADPESRDDGFLSSANWQLDPQPTSILQGAFPSVCQELNAALHPHLNLTQSMVHVPTVQPGDYVAWHCDTIHAVDKTHAGRSDASVMYIPSCPLTENNANYLVRQREAFLIGTPGPDFPGGKGESEHIGRPTADFYPAATPDVEISGESAMGLAPLQVGQKHTSKGQREVIRRANEILGLK